MSTRFYYGQQDYIVQLNALDDAANAAFAAVSADWNATTGTAKILNKPILAAVATSGNKADVGLGNVDNTSDVNKPVSTAQQAALNAKAPLTGAGTSGTWGISITGNAATATNVTWAGVTGKPTTLAGYGITDAPSLTGSGATGTWGISITGNAATATTATNANNLVVTTDNASAVANYLVFNRTGGVAAQPQYNSNNLSFVPSTGALTAVSFVGAGTGLTGTAAGLSIGGNAASATKLATSRTINGVAFDGTANITLPAATANGLAVAVDDASSTVSYPTFVRAGGGAVYDSNALSFVPSTGTLGIWTLNTKGSDSGLIMKSQNTTATGSPDQFFIRHNLAATEIGNYRGAMNLLGNATTATTLATARTINGVAFDGSANITLPAGSATSVPWSGVTGTPTTLAGYGITNAPTLTGVGASGNWHILADQATLILGTDTRGSQTGPNTLASPNVRWDFKANATDSLNDGGTYHGVMTLQQWSDGSGGGTRQLAFTDNDNMWLRGSGTAQSAYGGWKRVIDSNSITAYQGFQSPRDFPNGTLVTTNINYAVSSGSAWLAEIKGNSYGELRPFDVKLQGYIYNNTMIQVGGTSTGRSIPGIVVLNVGGNLCFWWPTIAYWHGFTVFVADVTGSGAEVNTVTSITNSAKPAGTKEVAIPVTTTWTDANLSPISTTGGTMTGTLNGRVPNYQTAITSVTNAPFTVGMATVPSDGTASFSPMMHGTTILNGQGYVQHLSLGQWRPGTIAWGGGFYVGVGGADANPTEYFLMKYGGNISHSSGTVTVNGNVTGSAGSLVGFGNTAQGGQVSQNNATMNGIYYVNDMAILGQTDGGLYVQAFSSAWVGQIYQDYRTGQIALRGKNNGTWGGWRTVLDSNNYTNYLPTALNGPAHTNGADGWFRSDGQCGWYSQTYGGGIYCTEGGMVRTYNNTSFTANTFYGSGAGLTGTATNLSAGVANKVAQGGTGTAMTFNWSGNQGGNQPTWLWGGFDGINHYVYNPSNFNVASAGYVALAPQYSWQASWASGTWSPSIMGSFVSASEGWFSYGGLLNFKPYAGSVGGHLQLYTPYSPSLGGNDLKFRLGNYDTGGWTGWKTLIASDNIASYTAGNTNSISAAVGNSYTWDGVQYFRSNKGASTYLGATASYALEAYCTDNGSAAMSFHRSGMYAVNMGLDPDNVFRIGGWSAAANLFQMDMSGNLTMLNNITAYSDERLKTNWRDVKPTFLEDWAKVKHGIYDRIDNGETQAGLSAQDAQKALPEVVGEDSDGILHLNYGAAAAVASVELAKEVLELRAELRKQSAIIKLLMEKAGY